MLNMDAILENGSQNAKHRENYELIEKLGESIYIHSALIGRAERAKEAVTYLEKAGAFNCTKK